MTKSHWRIYDPSNLRVVKSKVVHFSWPSNFQSSRKSQIYLRLKENKLAHYTGSYFLWCVLFTGNFLKFNLGYYLNYRFVAAMTDDPRFAEPIPNVTVALGRDASLPCVVENLGTYKVGLKLLFDN